MNLMVCGVLQGNINFVSTLHQHLNAINTLDSSLYMPATSIINVCAVIFWERFDNIYNLGNTASEQRLLNKNEHICV